MKKWKAYFKMIFAALFCLVMSIIPGKRNGQVVGKLTEENGLSERKRSRFFIGTGILGNGMMRKCDISGSGTMRICGKVKNGYAVSADTGPGDKIIVYHLPRADNFQGDARIEKRMEKQIEKNPPPMKKDAKSDGRKILVFPGKLCESLISF